MRILAASIALIAATSFGALAQTTTPPTTPSSPPAAEQAPTPTPPRVTTPEARPSEATPALLGLDVFSQDQSRLGKVERVVQGGDGKPTAIMIKTGGFLGFGGKMVEIPESKYQLRGTNVQVQMTADEVGKLPEAKDPS